MANTGGAGDVAVLGAAAVSYTHLDVYKRQVFKWLRDRGGLEAMKQYNEEKAKILYDFLDQSKMFKGTVVKKDRSLMNVPFVTGDEEMDALFVKESKAAGLENLKGHRTVGGLSLIHILTG